jgi:hypothetical protein
VWEVHQLHIAPARHGGGAGRRLFDAAVDRALAAGAAWLTLWVVASNTGARRFYEHRGLRPDGARKRRKLTPAVTLDEVRYVVDLAAAADARSVRPKPAQHRADRADPTGGGGEDDQVEVRPLGHGDIMPPHR